MRMKFACLMLTYSALAAPAIGQGLMENTSVQGTAAGLGGGLGASAYKLFNSNTGAAATNKTINSAQKTLTASPGVAQKAPDVKGKTALLTASAKQKEDAGDLVGAAKIWQELAQFRQKAVGREDPVAGDAFKKAGTTLISAKQFSQAEDCLKMSLGYSNRINGAQSVKALPILLDLADSLKEQERVAEAIPYYKQALSLQERSTADPKTALATKANLGEAYVKAGTYQEAEPLLRQSVELAQQQNCCSQAQMTSLLKNYELALQKNNKIDEAEVVAKKLSALQEGGSDKKAP